MNLAETRILTITEEDRIPTSTFKTVESCVKRYFSNSKYDINDMTVGYNTKNQFYYYFQMYDEYNILDLISVIQLSPSASEKIRKCCYVNSLVGKKFKVSIYVGPWS